MHGDTETHFIVGCEELSDIDVTRFVAVVAIKYTLPLVDVLPELSEFIYVDGTVIVSVKQSCVRVCGLERDGEKKGGAGEEEEGGGERRRVKERRREKREKKGKRKREEYVNGPIISRQVSGLKWDQFPLVSACCSSIAVMEPLLSVSTATNHE